MRWIALILIAAIAAAQPDSVQAVGLSSYVSARLNAAVEDWLGRGSKRRAPAMSVAIGLDGELVFARGYGEARPGRPATACTVYHIGSLSKQFTAAAMLHLIERGARAPLSQAVVTLDSTPREFFDHLEKWDMRDARPVTLRALLTMTSGLPNLIDHPPAHIDPWNRIPPARLLDELRKLPLARRAKAFSYNNFNYFLLAQMIESVGAADARGPASFADFLMAEVIGPAGLINTGFIGDDDPYRSMTAAVANWGDTPAYKRRPAFIADGWLKGAAEMTSSAVDLFSWNKALMEGRIMSPASRDLMFADAAQTGPSTAYGMGVFIRHAPGWDWFSHTGYVPGFTSSNAIVRNAKDATWIGISLLTNADGVRGFDELSAQIVEILAQERAPSP